jgi:coenzyme F420-reducing hydrogenase beta subunit
VIVRTEAGRAFLDAAVKEGWIEVEPFPEDRLRLLKEASFNKKRRVLEEFEKEAKKNIGEPYLRISQEEKEFFLRARGPETEE